MENDIILNGLPIKNKAGRLITIISLATVPLSFIVAYLTYNFGEKFTVCYISYKLYYLFSFKDFYFGEFFGLWCFHGILLILGVIGVISGIAICKATEGCGISITSNEIRCTSASGRTDLFNIQDISKAEECSFKGITITVNDKAKSYLCFANRNELMNLITSLIENKNTPNKKDENIYYEIKNADQLIKYKKLLDEGAITQEEYEAKKNYILGL